MAFGLTQPTISKIQSVFASHPQVEKAILYGSRAKGNYKNGSDIDLTLVGGKDLDSNVLGKIMDEIDDLLLPYSFDLSIHSQITDAPVLDHIKRIGIIFYEKNTSK